MATTSTEEAIREVQDTIVRLYIAVHSVFCDESDCPAAQIFDDLSEPNYVDPPPHENTLILILLGILDNISECLDLIRILLASRDDSGEPDQFAQPTTTWDDVSSGTTFYSPREDTNTDAHGPFREPPVPRLYHDQWTRSPTVSPPAYGYFCQSWERSIPRAPAPSPATRGSGTTTPEDVTPIPGDQQGAGRDGQDEQHGAGIWTAPFTPASRTPRLLVGMRCRRRLSSSSSNSDHQPRGRFAAWIESDSEGED